MNRRQFLYQTLSLSAVAVGAGYATLDMIRRSGAGPEWMPSPAENARKAAEKALKHAPPVDEAMVRRAYTAPQPSVELPREFARPAESLVSGGPGTDTPNHPIHSGDEAKLAQTRTSQPRANSATQPEPALQVADGGAQAAPTDDALLEESAATVEAPAYVAEAQDEDEKVRQKVQHFEYDFSDDVFITEQEFQLLVAILERLNRVQAYVGHGNFNVLSFDDMLRYARYQSRIGEFTETELQYMEKLFYDDVSRLGFFGERVVPKLNHQVKEADIEKIPGTGHYLFKGHSQAFYEKVRSKVGGSLVLTSGIRGVVKQYHLFMAKVVQAEGNLSRASRSLAPPGHSYHAIGDFDVGRVGGGLSNFTAEFAATDEFKRLQDLGFVQIRYTTDNDFGVRYEPWHIRVVDSLNA